MLRPRFPINANALKEESILRAFASHASNLAEHIERVLRYRTRVGQEFERLVTIPHFKMKLMWAYHHYFVEPLVKQCLTSLGLMIAGRSAWS